MDELVKEIDFLISKSLLSSRMLLDNFRVIDDSNRFSVKYNDELYFRFYHYLGKLIKPRKIIKANFSLGLQSGCFLRTCKTVEYFLGLHVKNSDFYSPRLGKANIKDFYKKTFEFIMPNDVFFCDKLKESDFDLAIINQEVNYDYNRQFLDLIWETMNLDGLIVVDNLKKGGFTEEAFLDFCKSKNKQPFFIKSKSCIGLIKR